MSWSRRAVQLHTHCHLITIVCTQVFIHLVFYQDLSVTFQSNSALKWWYDKILLDYAVLVRSGWTAKYLDLGHGAWNYSARIPCARAKYFPIQPSHSVNKYILLLHIVGDNYTTMTFKSISRNY